MQRALQLVTSSGTSSSTNRDTEPSDDELAAAVRYIAGKKPWNDPRVEEQEVVETTRSTIATERPAAAAGSRNADGANLESNLTDEEDEEDGELLAI